MQRRIGFLACLLLMAGSLSMLEALAQPSSVQTYALLPGSQLLDDCPICDRPVIPLPLRGTFTLSLGDQNPLFTRYEITGISFEAGASPDRTYHVTGTGSYRVGGEVAVMQDLFLEVQVSDGFTNQLVQFTGKTNGAVAYPWPRIQMSAEQTNGTPGRVYHLDLVAVAVPKLRVAIADQKTGALRLEWEPGGSEVQVERATAAPGPYEPVTPITRDSSFTDAGVITNSTPSFYRLRLY